MKKVLIIGATGGLAQYVIDALKEIDGISLTLFSRSVNRLSKSVSQGASIVQGDAMNINDLEKAIEGQDIVPTPANANPLSFATTVVFKQ
jgi:uncharacterized protein YbjT (DUF2867 family)